MLQIARDGLWVFGSNLAGIAAFLTATWGFGLLGTDILLGGRVADGLRRIAALCIGPVVLGLLAYVLVIAETLIPHALTVGGYALIAAGAVRMAVEGKQIASIRVRVTGLGAAALVGAVLLLLLRLAFLRPLLLPPYTDSVVHYQIVRGFLHPELASQANLSLQTLGEQYYHFGFHSLAAWLSSVTGMAAEASMPLIGQLLLVLAPVSIGVFAGAVTGSAVAGLWAAVLAAFGWQMPAFAANWGKYPAIAALATVPAVVICADIAFRVRGVRAVAAAVALLGGLAVLHTRSLIVVMLAAGSAVVARRLVPAEGFSGARAVRFSILYVISLAPLYYLLGEFYSAVIPALLIMGTLPFAFRSYPAVAIGAVLFSYGLWVATVVPAATDGLVPTVLNEQFVEMVLYMPLALLGGAGFAGLVSRHQRRRGAGIVPTTRVIVVAVAGLGAAALIALASLGAYPDACCNFVTEADRRALEWIRTETPADSLVLVAGFKEGGQFFGTDAGIWVQALSERDSNRMTFDTDWAESGEIERLCRDEAVDLYIYVGGGPYSFDETGLAAQPWAAPAFAGGRTTIHEVGDCGLVGSGPAPAAWSDQGPNVCSLAQLVSLGDT